MGDAEAGGSDRPGRRRSSHEAEYRKGGREAALAIEGLDARYGASQVLFGVDLEVGAGETVALVGRNGAGKTTTLQSVMGMADIARSGSIRVEGRETIGMPAHRIARLGVALVAEGRRVFGSLTVEENLQVALGSGRRSGARVDGGAEEEQEKEQEKKEQKKKEQAAGGGDGWSLERVFEAFPLLARVRDSKGAWLSGGEQQALAIARALVANPRVLLLDEPSEGLAPRLVEALIEQLKLVQSAGLAVLLAEQHAGVVGELASRVYVLERGTVHSQSGLDALHGPL